MTSKPCTAADRSAENLTPGADFVVCVTRSFTLPWLPKFLDLHRNTVTGRFIVHVDNFRSVTS
jgi:hypothetical protein